MISQALYEEHKARNDKLMAWVDSIRGKNGWVSYKPEDKPADVPDISNEERSAMEVFEFVTNPPDRYFLYINEESHKATTWTGEELGNVLFGREYRDNFGGRRVSITVRGINGRKYHGTYYKSSGDYARVKVAKS